MAFDVDRLNAAIRLRQEGRSQEALQIFLELHAQAPDEPLVNYHCAWTHDTLGHEHEAVPFYERAIEGGLDEDERRGALLGLGSTYRSIGQHEKAIAVLRRGIREFAPAREFEVFLSMTLYNVGDHREAMRLLLHNLAETSMDPAVQRYQRAILFYSDKLDQTW